MVCKVLARGIEKHAEFVGKATNNQRVVHPDLEAGHAATKIVQPRARIGQALG